MTSLLQFLKHAKKSLAIVCTRGQPGEGQSSCSSREQLGEAFVRLVLSNGYVHIITFRTVIPM